MFLEVVLPILGQLLFLNRNYTHMNYTLVIEHAIAQLFYSNIAQNNCNLED